MLILGKDSVLKRSAFGGFKKEDVLDYIEKLQQEIVNLKRDASDCAAYKREAEELRAYKIQAEATADALRNEAEALKVENSALIEKNASLTLKIEQLNSILEKNKADAAEAAEKYEELHAEYSKITDVNALVNEVRDSVAAISADAKASVDSVYDDVNSAANRFKTVSVNFESSLVSLKSGTDALLSTLSDASQRLASVGKEEE